jgi:hypothetical protein
MASFMLTISKAIHNAINKNDDEKPVIDVVTNFNAPVDFNPVVEAPLSAPGGNGGLDISDVSPDSAVTAYNVPLDNAENGTVDLDFTGGGSSVSPSPGGLFGLPWEILGFIGLVALVLLVCCCLFPGSMKAIFKWIVSLVRSLVSRTRSVDDILTRRLQEMATQPPPRPVTSSSPEVAVPLEC